jgi:hypothetical protein
LLAGHGGEETHAARPNLILAENDSTDTRRIRVLILDAEVQQSLAACRALGRAGYDVGVAGYDDRRVAAHSRYAARYHRLPDPRGPNQPFHDALQLVVETHQYMALVATDDGTLARLAYGGVSIPSFPSLGAPFERLVDKIGLADICASAGVGYPTTFAPNDVAEAERVMSSLSFPLIVKAGRSAVADADRVFVRKGATLAWDCANALRAYEALQSEGLRPIVQTRIHPGQKIHVRMSRRNGSTDMRLAYRSLREVQPSGADAAAFEAVSPENGPGALAVQALERVLDSAAYEGLAVGQFVLSPDRGVFLIEVNPRLGASAWFAEKLGQRAAERGIRLALGLGPLPEVKYPSGRRFHHVHHEWRWFVRAKRRDEALLELLRTNRPWDIYEGINFGDPLATIARFFGHLR